MIEFLSNLDIENLLQVLLQLLGAASLIATQTPNSSANALIDTLLRLVNGFAGNWGKSKNSDA